MQQRFVDLASMEESVALLKGFGETLKLAKSDEPPHKGFGWYPYDTLANWWIFESLLAQDFTRLQHILRDRPVLDAGCADGELTFFLSRLGCDVTAVDNPGTNFNFMYGVKALKERLGSDAKIVEIDIDSSLDLPGDDYGLVLLLGILYHLKNPFSILERLARRTRYCMLSTRIAAVTPKGVPMQDESLAYLVDSNEMNNDSTNFWIFSETGVLRLLKRTGWEVRGFKKLGCAVGSNPASNDADERMFLFLRSRVRSAPAKIELRSGWHPAGPEAWCWVDRTFSLDVLLLEPGPRSEFELRFVAPEMLVQGGPLAMSCRADGIDLGTQVYGTAGNHVYRAALPPAVGDKAPLRLEFSVEHKADFGSDARDLGVVIPWRGEVSGIDLPMSFWVS